MILGVDFVCLGYQLVSNDKYHSLYVYAKTAVKALNLKMGSEYIKLIVDSTQEKYVKEDLPENELLVVPCGWARLALTLSSGKFSGLRKIRNTNHYIKKYKKCAVANHIDRLWIPAVNDASIEFAQIFDYLTIHDLHFLDEKYTSKKCGEAFRKVAEGAGQLITDSEATKKDIVKNYQPQKEIRVCHNALKFDKLKTIKKWDIPSKFILNVNFIRPYKNQMTLIKAFQTIMNKIDEDLVLVAGSIQSSVPTYLSYYREVIEYISNNHLENHIHIYIGLSDEELNYLYQNASLFVTSSLLEGFGYTPIEAALFHVPVLSTMCGSLYEVTMGLSNYVEDPMDINEMAKKIELLLETPPDYRTLDYIAKRYKEEYSMENYGNRLWGILCES